MSRGRSSEAIAGEVRAITARVVGSNDVYTLWCTVDGTASGISAAFVDALDRADRTGRSSERLHELIVEYAESMPGSTGRISDVVEICFSEGATTFAVK